MSDFLSTEEPEYAEVAIIADRFRWDSFVEGYIVTRWRALVKVMITEVGVRLSPVKWGTQFIDQLLQITHKQWIYWNSGVHFKMADGITLAEHNKYI